MVGRRPLLSCAAFGALWLAAPVGCRQGANTAADIPGERMDGGSDAMAPPALDISVTGCASFTLQGETPLCNGVAPLTVTFSPVASPGFTAFRWTFGDGTPSSVERTPTHTYTVKGSYDVSVTAQGTFGTLVQPYADLISVAPVATGAGCDVDQQCGEGLRCLCAPGSGCSAPPARGICSTACSTGFCGSRAVCAAIALGGADGGVAGPLCLADCAGGTACDDGFVCQSIPGGPSGGAAWVQGCLPLGAAHDFGASCRDANGALDDAVCTTGFCADLGALGMCTIACDETHPCPSGAACALLAGNAQECLPACTPARPCTSDPALACRLAMAAGTGVDGGVTISAGASGAAYCAPR